jgi:hypothetical protein
MQHDGAEWNGTNFRGIDDKKGGLLRQAFLIENFDGLKAELQPYSTILARWSSPFRASLPN